MDVYDTRSFMVKPSLDIPNSTNLLAIVACQQNHCLYISADDSKKSLDIIHRYDPQSTSVINNWSLGGECRGLSVTKIYNVLATLFHDRRVEEYTPNGISIRSIDLGGIFDFCDMTSFVIHCFELSNDQFIVCYDNFSYDLSGLYIVVKCEHYTKKVQSYGGRSGSGVGLMDGPRQMAVEKYGHVLVADFRNNRVELLSPSLTHVGYISTTGYELDGPWALHFDNQIHRLYIGESGDKNRLFILKI